MLVGYNTNISYKGTIYHVQTEDSGLKNPHIITLLYLNGVILSRKKTSYERIVSAPDYKEKVREMMKEQHKAMIKELIAGKHTQPQPVSETTAGATSETETSSTAPEAQLIEASHEEKDISSDETKSSAAIPKKQITKSLDDILIDYILKEEKKE